MIDAQGNYVPDVTPVTTTNTPIATPVVTNMAVPTPQDIYSAQNIQQASMNPVAMPDLSNASAIYDFYLNGADVNTARTAAQADTAALAAAKATARNRQIAIEGNPLESQQFIVGQQARAGQLDDAKLAALADAAAVSSANYATAKQTASEKANVALSQRAEIVDYIKQNPNAKINFTDTVESAAAKVKKYNSKVAKEAEKKVKEDYKKNLKATLMQLGVSTKNANGGSLNTKAMEKALTDSYKSKADAEKKLNDLKLKSAELDIAKGYKDLNTKEEKSVTFTDSEQRRLASELVDEAESKGLYGNYAWEYAVKEGNKLGVAIETGSPFVNSIRTRFGMSSEAEKKAGDK